RDLRVLAAALAPLVNGHPLPIFFAGRPESGECLPTAPDLQVGLSEPSLDDRNRHWERVSELSAAERAHLAAAFRLGAEEIGVAAGMASSLAAWWGSEVPSLRDAQTAARSQAQPRLTA